VVFIRLLASAIGSGGTRVALDEALDFDGLLRSQSGMMEEPYKVLDGVEFGVLFWEQVG
jgi:hypothetical protein